MAAILENGHHFEIPKRDIHHVKGCSSYVLHYLRSSCSLPFRGGVHRSEAWCTTEGAGGNTRFYNFQILLPMYLLIVSFVDIHWSVVHGGSSSEESRVIFGLERG